MAKASAAASPADAPGAHRHLFLIDGSGFLFRAFHALPPLTRGDGTPTNAVLGFSTMLMKLMNETDADHIVIIFDASRASFRNQMFDGYKANRSEPPSELIPQFKLVREAAEQGLEGLRHGRGVSRPRGPGSCPTGHVRRRWRSTLGETAPRGSAGSCAAAP